MFNIDYLRPQNLGEALGFIQEHGPDTTILAGGTDVMIDMRAGVLKSRYLLEMFG